MNPLCFHTVDLHVHLVPLPPTSGAEHLIANLPLAGLWLENGLHLRYCQINDLVIPLTPNTDLPSLTNSNLILHSHELTTDLSCFLQKSHPKKFGTSAEFISKLDSKLNLKKMPCSHNWLVNVWIAKLVHCFHSSANTQTSTVTYHCHHKCKLTAKINLNNLSHQDGCQQKCPCQQQQRGLIMIFQLKNDTWLLIPIIPAGNPFTRDN